MLLVRHSVSPVLVLAVSDKEISGAYNIPFSLRTSTRLKGKRKGGGWGKGKGKPLRIVLLWRKA